MLSFGHRAGRRLSRRIVGGHHGEGGRRLAKAARVANDRAARATFTRASRARCGSELVDAYIARPSRGRSLSSAPSTLGGSGRVKSLDTPAGDAWVYAVDDVVRGPGEDEALAAERIALLP